MKIVIPDDFPPVMAGSKELERLKVYGEVILYETKSESEAELIERLQDAKAVINVRSYTVFNSNVLDSLPDLELVSILGTGTDNVDFEAARRNNVVVTNTPEASTISVAEHAIALMFSVARHTAFLDRKIRQGEWHHPLGFEIYGKTMGILGLGNIGQYAAKLAKGLGMNLVGWSRTYSQKRAEACGVELVEFDEVFKTADVVSIHLRLAPDTEGLIGERQLGLMKTSAILINTARGAIVDQDALITALEEKRIAGAGIDVFPEEPLSQSSPLIGMDNVVLSPHIGWVTNEASERLRQMPVDNIIAYFEGKPANVVNPEVL